MTYAGVFPQVSVETRVLGTGYTGRRKCPGAVPAARDVTDPSETGADMPNPTHLPIDVASWTERDQRRFDAKVRVDEATGCHLWCALITEKGYGRFKLNGKTFRAHRIAWTLANGPIPDGLQIDHLCRVRNCVNPEHMEPVDNRTNTLRGDTITAALANRTHCEKGHELAGDNLVPYSLRKGERRCRACNKEYFRLLHQYQSAAAQVLGLTIVEYLKAYGYSGRTARRIIESAKGARV